MHPVSEFAADAKLVADRRVHLERVWSNGSVEEVPRRDAAAATRAALANPLGFPPLAASVVPGDRVAIALDETVPCVASIVRGMIESLREAGIEDEAISLVTRDAATSQRCRTELSELGVSAIRHVVHDPDDPLELCLVGVTKRNQPLLINRTIFDADVVLPIGCARVRRSSVFGSLFPRFSNAESIERFRAAPGTDAAATRAARATETDEAGWLIGVPMLLEVVPGGGESIAHIVAGVPDAVAARSAQLCRQHWELHSPRRASLVIATVTGGAHAQTWDNVARALSAAEQLVTEDGAVAICTNLDQRPGESLGRLIRSQDFAMTERRLLQDHAEDSWAAWQLARALQRGPVYFLSQLNPETVEDMGMAPVADMTELTRLASRHDSVAVLEDSQYALPAVEGEEHED